MRYILKHHGGTHGGTAFFGAVKAWIVRHKGVRSQEGGAWWSSVTGRHSAALGATSCTLIFPAKIQGRCCRFSQRFSNGVICQPAALDV